MSPYRMFEEYGTTDLAELRAAKLRRLYAELDALDPSEAARLAAEHRAALEAEAGLRRWQCPQCFVACVQRDAPHGWIIVEPFTRVAACAVCRPMTVFGSGIR